MNDGGSEANAPGQQDRLRHGQLLQLLEWMKEHPIDLPPWRVIKADLNSRYDARYYGRISAVVEMGSMNVDLGLDPDDPDAADRLLRALADEDASEYDKLPL